jgi:hypothetical protein
MGWPNLSPCASAKHLLVHAGRSQRQLPLRLRQLPLHLNRITMSLHQVCNGLLRIVIRARLR